MTNDSWDAFYDVEIIGSGHLSSRDDSACIRTFTINLRLSRNLIIQIINGLSRGALFAILAYDTIGFD